MAKETAETPEMKDGDREEYLGMVLAQDLQVSALRPGRWLWATCLPVPLPVPGADAHPESQGGGRALYLLLDLGFSLLLCHLREPEGSLNITERLV